MVSAGEIAKNFAAKNTDKARVLPYSEISNWSGFVIPDEAMELIMVAAIPRKPNIHVYVDGTMVWGPKSIDANTKHTITAFVPVRTSGSWVLRKMSYSDGSDQG